MALLAPVAIVVNEGAGSARTPRVRRAIKRAQAALDADLHVTDTRDAGVLAGWLEDIARPYRLLIVAGGDGSLSVAYNVLAGSNATLGYIPAGFGNATAHLLRLPRDPEALVAVLERGESRAIDLVDAGGRLCLFAGAGWDALVAERYAAGGAQRTRGWAMAIARSLPDLRSRVSVRLGSEAAELYRGPLEQLVVSTTPWYGRGLLVNPGATPDAGALTARVYPGPALAHAVAAARWITHRRPRGTAWRSTSFTLRSVDGTDVPVQADGDVIGRRSEWAFRVVPAAISMVGAWPSDRIGDGAHR